MSLRGWPGWVLVAASAVANFSVPVADNDLWGHVYFGREILSSGHLPAVNEYSYTAASYPWINHEILAECIFAAMYQGLGAPGLLALKLALGLATLLVMARTTCRRTNDRLAAAIALVLATSLMSYGYLVRPQVFSFFALAVVWDCLIADSQGQGRASRWIVPLVFAGWINTHGGAVAGIAVLLTYTALSWWARPNGGPPWGLAAVSGISICALFLNPYGFELPAFLVRDLLRSREISEWAAIPLFEASNLQFKIAVALCVVGALRSKWRDVPELAIVGLAAAITLRHERHLPIFTVLATPHLAASIAQLIDALRARLPEFSRGAAVTLAVGMLGIAAFQVSAAWRLNRDLGFQIYVPATEFPIDAVRFLHRERLAGNLALSFDWGEYAIWHLYPSCRVSVDGRYTTAYPPEVIERSWRFMKGVPGWDEILTDASIALVDRRQPAARMLAAQSGWRRVYSDPTAAVFVREGTIPSGRPSTIEASGPGSTFP